MVGHLETAVADDFLARAAQPLQQGVIGVQDLVVGGDDQYVLVNEIVHNGFVNGAGPQDGVRSARLLFVNAAHVQEQTSGLVIHDAGRFLFVGQDVLKRVGISGKVYDEIDVLAREEGPVVGAHRDPGLFGRQQTVGVPASIGDPLDVDPDPAGFVRVEKIQNLDAPAAGSNDCDVHAESP